MAIQFWKCECGKSYAGGVSRCRKCGKVKPTYGIIENKVDTPKANKKRKPRKSKDPLISYDENKLYVSTLKFIDK